MNYLILLLVITIPPAIDWTGVKPAREFKVTSILNKGAFRVEEKVAGGYLCIGSIFTFSRIVDNDITISPITDMDGYTYSVTTDIWINSADQKIKKEDVESVNDGVKHLVKHWMGWNQVPYLITFLGAKHGQEK